jgi:hypothetical protein
MNGKPRIFKVGAEWCCFVYRPRVSGLVLKVLIYDFGSSPAQAYERMRGKAFEYFAEVMAHD